MPTRNTNLSLFCILITLLPSCYQAEENPIDNINNEEDLVHFLTKNNLVDSNHIFLTTDRKKVTLYSSKVGEINIDTLPVYSIGDYTLDGKTDLLYHFNNHSYQVQPIVIEYVAIDSFIIHKLTLSRFIGRKFAYTIHKENKDLIGLFQKDFRGAKESGLYTNDTLTYKEKEFIDYVESKEIELPISISIKNEGTWSLMVDSMYIDVVNQTYSLTRKFENDSLSIHTGKVRADHYRILSNIIKNINYKKLDSLYIADWTDDDTYHTSFEFKAKRNIHVEDYGLVSTKSMLELYKIFSTIVSRD